MRRFMHIRITKSSENASEPRLLENTDPDTVFLNNPDLDWYTEKGNTCLFSWSIQLLSNFKLSFISPFGFMIFTEEVKRSPLFAVYFAVLLKTKTMCWSFAWSSSTENNNEIRIHIRAHYIFSMLFWVGSFLPFVHFNKSIWILSSLFEKSANSFIQLYFVF